MAEKYSIHEVIISDSKGNLFNYHSDYMNENFSYDKEFDQITKYVPTQVQVMLEDKLQNAVEVAQELWQCLNRGYTYSEAQIHMRAFRDGKTTVKKVVVQDKEEKQC
ncbi:hypothetical protein [uncultured Mediterranean phage uvMED]|nr:hypothetical protein [uncultured Mediterranean phage uvMED]